MCEGKGTADSHDKWLEEARLDCTGFRFSSLGVWSEIISVSWDSKRGLRSPAMGSYPHFHHSQYFKPLWALPSLHYFITSCLSFNTLVFTTLSGVRIRNARRCNLVFIPSPFQRKRGWLLTPLDTMLDTGYPCIYDPPLDKFQFFLNSSYCVI